MKDTSSSFSALFRCVKLKCLASMLSAPSGSLQTSSHTLRKKRLTMWYAWKTISSTSSTVAKRIIIKLAATLVSFGFDSSSRTALPLASFSFLSAPRRPIVTAWCSPFPCSTRGGSIENPRSLRGSALCKVAISFAMRNRLPSLSFARYNRPFGHTAWMQRERQANTTKPRSSRRFHGRKHHTSFTRRISSLSAGRSNTGLASSSASFCRSSLEILSTVFRVVGSHESFRDSSDLTSKR
mmetsp:Transcript_757/g.2731  ORF Transcript_757/g.2731 Transcript_757/m.2731 type:complete len:239 (-) Transcript_757:1421-2137(-)